MLKVDTDAKAGYLELTVDGVIHKADYEAAIAAVDELLKTHEQLNVVEVVRDIGWIEPQIWWKDLLFHLSHRNFIHRAAVVGCKQSSPRRTGRRSFACPCVREGDPECKASQDMVSGRGTPI